MKDGAACVGGYNRINMIEPQLTIGRSFSQNIHSAQIAEIHWIAMFVFPVSPVPSVVVHMKICSACLLGFMDDQ